MGRLVMGFVVVWGVGGCMWSSGPTVSGHLFELQGVGLSHGALVMGFVVVWAIGGCMWSSGPAHLGIRLSFRAFV